MLSTIQARDRARFASIGFLPSILSCVRNGRLYKILPQGFPLKKKPSWVGRNALIARFQIPRRRLVFVTSGRFENKSADWLQYVVCASPGLA